MGNVEYAEQAAKQKIATTAKADTRPKEREKLEISKEEARGLIWDEIPDDLEIVSDSIVDHRRWNIDHEIIVKRISDGKYFRDYYSVGATESQDESPWDYEDPDFREVFPVEKTIIDYE